MSSNPTMESSTKPYQLFKFNPELSVAATIKSGVLTSFSHYSKDSTVPADRIKLDIAEALRSLAEVKVPAQWTEEKAPRAKTRRAYKFFSSRELALVEIEEDPETDILTIEHIPMMEKEAASVKTADQRRNTAFKGDVAELIVESVSVCRSPVVETVLKGIYSVLILAEDSAGSFVEEFEKHLELFKQLTRVYESARLEDLDRSKGCYSHGIAVEEGLKMIGEAQAGDV